MEKFKHNDPYKFFEEWYLEWQKAGPVDSTAMIVATSSKSGMPSLRTVLLKEWTSEGFVFYTNFDSKKSKELIENPHCEILFYMDKLMRQIRISGKVMKISEQESDVYFSTRPYGSQIGAWASKQSAVIPNREWLEVRVKEFSEKYPEGASVPRPSNWGGWRVIATQFEFWQGQPNRLHDRWQYTFDNNNWKTARLSP